MTVSAARSRLIIRNCSTERSDEEVNRDFYSFGNKFRMLSDEFAEADMDRPPTLSEVAELELELALKNPLLSKYGIRKRDLLEGCAQAIETVLLESGSREVLELSRNIPEAKMKELLELASETHCQDEIYRVNRWKCLGLGSVLKKAQVSDVTLTEFKTEIVPYQRPLLYYAWKAVDFVEVAVDNACKALARKILMAQGTPSNDPAMVNAMAPLQPDKDSLLYSYPPGSVAVLFEVQARVFEVRQPVRWVSTGDNTGDNKSDQQGQYEESGEEQRHHIDVRCEFYGCISGQVPLQWKVEYMFRRRPDANDASDDES